MKLVLAMLPLLAALAGCPEKPVDQTIPGGPTPDKFVKEQKACERSGGRWGTGGLSGFYICYKPTRDANKHCERGTDCEGLCLARSQTCTVETPLFGCNDILMDNGLRGGLCID